METRVIRDTWRPQAVPQDRIEQFMLEHPGVIAVDTLAEQINEWLQAYPGRLLADDIEHQARWYWLSWKNVLARVLPPELFEELLLSRQRFLFTDSNIRTLRSKRVGIAGLSVGSRVLEPLAHGPTLALFRLADMDTIGLSNLGRLSAGIAELGLPKVVLGARMVTEVRPFAESVEILDGGLNHANLDQFLDGLDLVVCAMDDPAMKLRLRQAAARLGVDVVMGTDVEQGLIDLEPYATDPSYKPFHGQLSPQTVQLLESANGPDPRLIAAVAEIVGLENLTVPALHMAIELLQGRAPAMSQLATTAASVGGNVARMIHLRLCGYPVRTGRINLGLEDALRMDTEEMTAARDQLLACIHDSLMVKAA